MPHQKRAPGTSGIAPGQVLTRGERLVGWFGAFAPVVPVLTAALVRFKGWASSLRLASRDTPKLVAWYPGQMTGNERQRQTLIESLRVRFAKAVADNDADAKAALFKEAVYLGIQPDAFTGSTIDETA